jgi:N-acetylneuraminic acid mutarotase
MNKIISLILVFLLISGSFVGVFCSASASHQVENIWVPKTPMSQTRFSLGVVAVDDKIYAIGGFTQSGYLDTNEQYDPVTDTWTTLASMPTPRNEFAIATCQDRIYCIGGITPKQSGGWYRCGINEVYDVVTNSWSTKDLLINNLTKSPLTTPFNIRPTTN